MSKLFNWVVDKALKWLFWTLPVSLFVKLPFLLLKTLMPLFLAAASSSRVRKLVVLIVCLAGGGAALFSMVRSIPGLVVLGVLCAVAGAYVWVFKRN